MKLMNLNKEYFTSHGLVHLIFFPTLVRSEKVTACLVCPLLKL